MKRGGARGGFTLIEVVVVVVLVSLLLTTAVVNLDGRLPATRNESAAREQKIADAADEEARAAADARHKALVPIEKRQEAGRRKRVKALRRTATARHAENAARTTMPAIRYTSEPACGSPTSLQPTSSPMPSNTPKPPKAW